MRGRAPVHGQSETPLYARWIAMRERTTRPGYKDFVHYGGRGIIVCERWQKFENFAEDMGPGFAPHLTLEREDVNGPYSPENCWWATRSEQMLNRQSTKRIEWQGEALTPFEWAARLGIKANTIVVRLRRGWTAEEALTGKRRR